MTADQTLFANALVWPATGEPAFHADVLIEADRIAAIRESRSLPREGRRVIDCAGATLMPGLVDGHSHLSFVELPAFADMRPAASPARACSPPRPR